MEGGQISWKMKYTEFNWNQKTALMISLFMLTGLSCQAQPTKPPVNKVEIYYQQNKGNDQPSVISGSVDKGKLENAKLLPFSGTNFHYFDTASYLAGRAFTSDKVLNAMLATYKILETEVPGRAFCVMECSNEHGGKIYPHRTHQNGLSVDFMMPLVKKGMPYYELDSIGQTHYFLDFNNQGQYKADTSISIDFELAARHILLLHEQAKKQGLKVSKVIIKIELKDELFAGEYGKKLKASGIYIVQNLTPLINSVHDDHYHIDFDHRP
ncbi:MAG TPA: replication initiation protein [Bacteroidetes bacterium]|nr:replication initiation protein [Bacteroidota bacterium]